MFLQHVFSVFQDHRSWVKLDITHGYVKEQKYATQDRNENASVRSCLSVSSAQVGPGQERLGIMLVKVQPETAGSHPPRE